MLAKSPIAGWRLYKQRYQLQGTRCVQCKKVFYPHKYLCHCGSTKFEPYHLNGNGTLETFTQVCHPMAEFASNGSYCLGLVKLEEGPRILAQISDSAIGELYIGQPVVAVFRKYFATNAEDIIHYGIKFIPIQKKS